MSTTPAQTARLPALQDREIRGALHKLLAVKDASRPGALVVDELSLGPSARADVVFLDSLITGYEIKSDLDSLARLPRQRLAYEAVCDRVWLVTTARHLDSAARLLPDWWGLALASASASGVELRIERTARAHGQQDSRALARLLWRRELAEICAADTMTHMGCRAPAYAMREVLSSRPPDEVADEVRERMLVRVGWRAVAPSERCDAPSRPAATSTDSRSRLRRPRTSR